MTPDLDVIDREYRPQPFSQFLGVSGGDIRQRESDLATVRLEERGAGWTELGDNPWAEPLSLEFV
jgi:hypothetical protein